MGLKSADEIEELQRELRRNERHKETKAEVMTTIEKIEGLDHRLDEKNKVRLDEYTSTLRITALD